MFSFARTDGDLQGLKANAEHVKVLVVGVAQYNRAGAGHRVEVRRGKVPGGRLDVSIATLVDASTTHKRGNAIINST